jgi:hypothetical protein
MQWRSRLKISFCEICGGGFNPKELEIASGATPKGSRTPQRGPIFSITFPRCLGCPHGLVSQLLGTLRTHQ